jgi:hypothetical protein
MSFAAPVNLHSGLSGSEMYTKSQLPRRTVIGIEVRVPLGQRELPSFGCGASQ